MRICVLACEHEYRYLQNLEDGVRSSGIGVTSGCEPTVLVTRKQTHVLCKSGKPFIIHRHLSRPYLFVNKGKPWPNPVLQDYWHLNLMINFSRIFLVIAVWQLPTSMNWILVIFTPRFPHSLSWSTSQVLILARVLFVYSSLNLILLSLSVY